MTDRHGTGNRRVPASSAAWIAAILLDATAFTWPAAFFRSYLFAYVFWLGLSLGCLALFMLHHLVSGEWGYVIQRVTEAGMRTIPLMAILFAPLLIGMDGLYPWIGATRTEAGMVIRTEYLQVPFFVARAILYFAFWIGAALLLTAWSSRQDRNSDPGLTRKIRLFSAPGLVVYVLLMTFASVDWLMSLEASWSSTVYGFLVVVGQVLTALGVVIICLRMLGDRRPLSQVVTERHVHHLGNLMLTFVILWAYMAYAQYIIIWSGNLPDENVWYLHRLTPGWSSLGLFVIITHFFIPFALLLSRRMKRSLRLLSWIAGWVVIMRIFDTFWLVVPAFHPEGISVSLSDVAAPIVLGAIWTAAFLQHLRQRSLIPLHDPRFVAPVELSGG